MKNQEQLRIVYISYAVGIIFSFIVSYFQKNNIEYYGIVGSIKVSTILSIWWWFYFNKGWKMPLLNKLLYKEDINGTWYGTYQSVGVNSDKINKGPIVIRIKQNFLNISVISYTEKYTNYSYSEELKYDEKSDMSGLIYVYSQKENSILDLSQRNGTADLKVLKDRNIYSLSGEFWTILNTKGKLDLVRVSNRQVNSFKDGQKLFKQYKSSEVE
ncbi:MULTISPECIES: Cap15 family cyclic dinucleotide receptor domain-containing protein [Clostridium]|uniref:Cap15 family cyclic dinucleotide receptor domain-containing protein n=1 Tax=Clostridium TaxID=1485 RepID=UPI0018A9ED01|nr:MULTISPECIES: hypothetical protein [Clostridium]MCQ2014616.1 hypothetical protein [Clostridium butyricum]MCQ2026761.1 hypothetical protein [Clostridium butyricum]MDB2136766.1 hypothetical protein [Clostridium butyricum]MDU1115051.1 hypothetical protein [Clostridium sp.]